MIKINGIPVELKTFNDGTYRLQNLSPSAIKDITWCYNNEQEFMALYYITSHAKEAGHHPLLNLPYVPNGRMDRTKQINEVFTLKYFCNLINSLDFKQVNIFDPHSYVTTALLNHVNVITPDPQIDDLLDIYDNATLFFPDEGAMKRYYHNTDVPYAFGVKVRDWETQKIESLKIAGSKRIIAGHDIIICDDILSRGSTLYAAARQLKDMGAKNIYVWVSHCENTVLQPHINGQSLLDIPNLITKVYTTNSIWSANHNKVEIKLHF